MYTNNTALNWLFTQIAVGWYFTARPVSQKLKIEFRFFSSKQSRVIGKHGFQSIFAFYLPKTQILGTRIITNGLYLLSNNASSKQKIGILDKFLR